MRLTKLLCWLTVGCLLFLTAQMGCQPSDTETESSLTESGTEAETPEGEEPLTPPPMEGEGPSEEEATETEEPDMTEAAEGPALEVPESAEAAESPEATAEESPEAVAAEESPETVAAEESPEAATAEGSPEAAAAQEKPEEAAPPAEEAAAEEAAAAEEPAEMQLADAGAAAKPEEPAEKAGGMPPVPVPEDNPMTPEKIELGKMLYFDKRLSADGTIACVTCHDPGMGWAEHRATSEGIGGAIGPVNAPPVVNAAYAPAQFWDGRAATLEEQALGPIQAPIEMGHKLDELVKQLNEIPGYKERFQSVFQTDVTSDGIAKAIAAFERTIVSAESPYDRFVAGDENALTAEQKEGWELFDGVGCSDCHAPPLFSTYDYVNAGLGMDKDPPHEGRKAVTGKDEDLGKVRVPSLREVADTAPYFHDGSAAELKDAVAAMAGGGKANPNLSETLKEIGGSLSEEEQVKVVAFLQALTSDYPKTEPPELP